MAPRQSELKAYSSLDNNAKNKKSRRGGGGHDTLTQLQDNSSMERGRTDKVKKTIQPAVRNINLDDDDGNEGSETMNESPLQQEQKGRLTLMEQDKIQLEQNLLIMQQNQRKMADHRKKANKMGQPGQAPAAGSDRTANSDIKLNVH